MKLAILAVSLSLLGAQARAAVVYELDPEIREKTKELLAEKNLDYRAMAQKRLKGTGHFDRQRIEITGMLSANDTRRIAPADFDDYIKPSVKADKGRTIDDWFRSWKGRDYDRDMEEMKPAMRGEMTERAIKTVAAYKDMEINEIVAHSWGSQLIYAAILNGEMRPPKKLIVLGVPDDDRAKWALLAARTGTEVFWGRAGNDAAALDKGVKIAKEAARGVDFEAKWDAVCADDKKRKIICLPHGRRPQPVVIIPVGNLPVRPLSPGSYLGHDREDYYDLVRKDYFKGTAQQLMVADSKKVVREMKKLEQESMNAAHAEARKLVEAARAQKAIAERDHDERLRYTLADMARRSCADPGSVTQAELDGLPEPYGKNFLDALPGGLGECSLMVYMSLGRGANAEDIRRKSSLSTPEAAPQVPPPHQAIRSFPQPTPVRSAPPQLLSTALPRFKEFATAACRAPEQVALEYFLLQPYDRSDARRDDYVAKELSAGMSGCSLRLFNALLATIRAGENGRIDRAWIRNMVAVSSAPSGSLPGDRSRGGAVPPTPDHDPVWGKIGPIIGR